MIMTSLVQLSFQPNTTSFLVLVLVSGQLFPVYLFKDFLWTDTQDKRYLTYTVRGTEQENLHFSELCLKQLPVISLKSSSPSDSTSYLSI